MISGIELSLDSPCPAGAELGTKFVAKGGGVWHQIGPLRPLLSPKGGGFGNKYRLLSI